MPAHPLDAAFARCRAAGRMAFIPFLPAGDPEPDATVELARTLARSGADVLELGFPYSDPIADGPVIQAAYTRALERGVTLDAVFAAAARVAGLPEFAQVPVVAMASYSLIHRRGPEPFIERAKASGIGGAVVPDLPFDESAALADVAAARGFKLIQLVTPTTPRDRAAAIARRSTGFLYCVSVTGITGARDQLPADVSEQLRWLRTQTELPLCVGFGVSRPEHVTRLRGVADGVIVGSALVRCLEGAARKPLAQVCREMGELAMSLAAATNQP